LENARLVCNDRKDWRSNVNRRTLILGGVVSAAAKPQANEGGPAARQRVSEAEKGFAGTMARRDHAAFSSYLSDEAVFLGNGDKEPALRGKRPVAEAWKKLFDAPTPPFSWGPEVVEVLDSGNLAWSSGPVRNPQGEVIGRFTSIWRLEADGRWRVIFDRGCPACRCV